MIIVECIVLFVIIRQIQEGSRKAREVNESMGIELSDGTVLKDDLIELESEIEIVEDESEIEVIEEKSSYEVIEENNDCEIQHEKSEYDELEEILEESSKTIEHEKETEIVNTENWGVVDWD